MNVFLWFVVGVLGVVLFTFSVYAFAEGGFGILEGAGFERCPRCGHHGLAKDGPVHPQDCPHRSYRQQLRHFRDAWMEGLHLGHH